MNWLLLIYQILITTLLQIGIYSTWGQIPHIISQTNIGHLQRKLKVYCSDQIRPESGVGPECVLCVCGLVCAFSNKKKRRRIWEAAAGDSSLYRHRIREHQDEEISGEKKGWDQRKAPSRSAVRRRTEPSRDRWEWYERSGLEQPLFTSFIYNFFLRFCFITQNKLNWSEIIWNQFKPMNLYRKKALKSSPVTHFCLIILHYRTKFFIVSCRITVVYVCTN